MKTKLILLVACAWLLQSCATSYQHPPVTPETDAAINAMMAH